MKEIEPTIRTRNTKDEYDDGVSYKEMEELEEELKNNPNIECRNGYFYFNPIIDENGKMYCFCHYELIKEDENTYHCIGANRHRYAFDEGTLHVDKFGNVLLAIPVPKDKEKKKEE